MRGPDWGGVQRRRCKARWTPFMDTLCDYHWQRKFIVLYKVCAGTLETVQGGMESSKGNQRVVRDKDHTGFLAWPHALYRQAGGAHLRPASL